MALRALDQEDFALGGGYALQAHGIVDRPSDDLDAYAPVMEVPTFEHAEELILAAAAADGLEAEIGKSDSYFRQVFVRDPSTGERVVVDLGYDLRTEAAVTISGVGHVISIDDAVGSKARALNDRRAARDYVDLDRVLQRPDWNAERLWEVFSRFRLAKREEFAADLRAGHEQDPDDYLAYGLTLGEMDAMFERLDKTALLILSPPE
jgi:Nucleotidyl transferase AbiEii toxin, Type IV TA system